jgi:phage-related protein
MDTLQCTFRIITRADIDNKKTLAEWLKEQQIYLLILWKAPPSFEEVAMISGPTKYTNNIMALKEIVHWLYVESEVNYKASQLRLKWRRRQTGDKSVSILVLSTDPSISDKVTSLLNKKNANLEPLSYYETYDYRYFTPSADIDEESYHSGIASVDLKLLEMGMYLL